MKIKESDKRSRKREASQERKLNWSKKVDDEENAWAPYVALGVGPWKRASSWIYSKYCYNECGGSLGVRAIRGVASLARSESVQGLFVMVL